MKLLDRLVNLMSGYSRLDRIGSFIDRYLEYNIYYEDSTEPEEDLVIEEFKPDIKNFREDYESLDIDGYVAIDSSYYRLGDTDRGYIIVYRGVLIEYGKENKVYRFGPYLIHITVDNALEIMNDFRYLLGLDPIGRDSLPTLYKVADRVRNFFERSLQLYAAINYRKHIILLDGSLMGGTIDTPLKLMKNIVAKGLGNGDSFIGICKSTSLRLRDGRLVTSLIPKYVTGYIDITNYLSVSVRQKVLGDVYITRFTLDGDVYRVDLKPYDGGSERLINHIRLNLEYERGYPYILYLAHAYSSFKKTDILGVKAYIHLKGGSLKEGVDRGYILPRY